MNEKLIEMAKAAGFVKDVTTMVVPSIAELERFAELIREDERRSRWLDIESAPKDFNIICCWNGDWQPQILKFSSHRGVWENDQGEEFNTPSKYQLLPEPPKEQS